MAIFNILKVDNFKQIHAVAPRTVSDDAVETARSLHETEDDLLPEN
jgi:hypothetical protein